MLIREVRLSKWSNSQGGPLTKEELEFFGGNVDGPCQMVVERGKIILTPLPKQPSKLKQLPADDEGEPLGQEDKYDWGPPRGRELL